MLNTHFAISVPGTIQLIEHLSVDHCATGFEWILLEKVGMQELESAINIAHMYSQYKPDEVFPAPGIEFAHPGVLTMDTIANHGVVFVNESEQARQITNIELPIRVHK